MTKVCIVVPNWNGIDSIGPCIDSLISQTFKAELIIIENGSTDGSAKYIQENYPNIKILTQLDNLGFAGGVNVGIFYAKNNGYDFVALFNNDAVADKNWLAELVRCISKDDMIGIVAPKLLSADGKSLDSTGEVYTTWGLPYPRGRGEDVLNRYDGDTNIFGASGGASLYRISMFQQIGYFDEDFFAYYEDVDISFRAQLYGWGILYAPDAIVLHKTGTTSSKIIGFTTYQTMKNLPWLLWKNVPLVLLPKIILRFYFVYLLFFLSAIRNGHGFKASKGIIISNLLMPKKLAQRVRIQHNRVVSTKTLLKLIDSNLPPNATNLRMIMSKLKIKTEESA